MIFFHTSFKLHLITLSIYLSLTQSKIYLLDVPIDKFVYLFEVGTLVHTKLKLIACNEPAMNFTTIRCEDKSIKLN